MRVRYLLAVFVCALATAPHARAATSSDFSVSKSGPQTTPPDNNAAFTITVTNNGPDAGAVTVSDPLPAGLSFVSVTPPAGFTCSDPGAGATSGTVTCNAVAMAPGSAIITVVFHVPGTTPSVTTFTNTVTISSPTDPNGANDSASASTTTPAISDLALVKTGPSTATADTDVSFNITVTNAGQDAAEEVQVSDVVSSGWSFVSATPAAGFNCTDPGTGATTGTIQCTTATMAVGSTANFTVVFHIPANAAPGTTFTNVATVASPTDPNDENNSSAAQTTTPPPPSGDVSIVKNGPASAPPDTDVAYTITVTNVGPDAAQNVSFTDTLPAGTPSSQMTFVSFSQTSGPAFSCGTPDVTTTCSIASLAVNATATFSFTGHIPSGTATGTVYSNTVSMTSLNDPTEENDTSGTALIVASADVAINKAAPPTAVAGGPTFAYVITVSNNGPDAATDVSFSDVLPAGVTFAGVVQDTGPAATCSGGGTVTCSILSPLPFMSSAQFTITVQPNASVANGTVLSNTATATASSADTNSNNNTSTAMTTVSAQADVSITKTAPATAIAGNNITYGITVANAGPSNAANVAWTDTLPANTTLVSETQTTGPTFTCTTGATINCSIATLTAGTSATFNIVVQVSPSAPASTINNTATVTSTTTDPDGNNNSSAVSTTVSAQADVSITKTAPAAVGAGTNLTYTISVINAGPSAATNVNWTDTLPPGTTFVSETQDSGPLFSCTTGATVSCGIVTLAPGAAAMFTMIVQVSSATPLGTVIPNTAIVSSTTTDPNGLNNSSTAATTVATSADLAVTKTGPATTPSNTTVVYVVGVSNAGPAAAASVTLTDNVPANMTFASASQTSGPAFNCVTPPPGGTGTITCTIASLASGASATFDFVFNVLPGAASGSTSTNTATVSATTADPNPANNSASVLTTVGASIPAISPAMLALLAAGLAAIALLATRR